MCSSCLSWMQSVIVKFEKQRSTLTLKNTDLFLLYKKYLLSLRTFYSCPAYNWRTSRKMLWKINDCISPKLLPIVDVRCYQQIWKAEKYFNFKTFSTFSCRKYRRKRTFLPGLQFWRTSGKNVWKMNNCIHLYRALLPMTDYVISKFKKHRGT